MSEFRWVRSELVCTTHKRTDTHSHSDTPDVDAEEVVEVKHVVSSNPHANVSDNNILGKRERGRESEGEREIANKEIWLGPLPIHIDSGSHVQGPFVASGVTQTHTQHTHMALGSGNTTTLAALVPRIKIKLWLLIPNLEVYHSWEDVYHRRTCGLRQQLY